tara:strand:- start:156 stop:533 length:378 start_codon:yes stop_codon:yes gene_type:complete
MLLLLLVVVVVVKRKITDQSEREEGKKKSRRFDGNEEKKRHLKFHQRQKKSDFCIKRRELEIITERDKEEDKEDKEDKELLSNNSGVVVLVAFFIFCLCAFEKSFRTLCVVVRTLNIFCRGVFPG